MAVEADAVGVEMFVSSRPGTRTQTRSIISPSMFMSPEWIPGGTHTSEPPQSRPSNNRLAHNKEKKQAQIAPLVPLWCKLNAHADTQTLGEVAGEQIHYMPSTPAMLATVLIYPAVYVLSSNMYTLHGGNVSALRAAAPWFVSPAVEVAFICGVSAMSWSQSKCVISQFTRANCSCTQSLQRRVRVDAELIRDGTCVPGGGLVTETMADKLLSTTKRKEKKTDDNGWKTKKRK